MRTSKHKAPRTPHKKGIELSINFLVMLILALTIFGFGVSFIYNLTSKAQDLRDISSEDLDTMVGDLFCSSTDRVCIVKDTQTVQAGDLAVFGVTVINIEDRTTFRVDVTASGGFTAQNTPLTNSLTIHPKEPFTLERNQERDLGIGIDVPPTTLAGTYIFNLRILKQDGTPYMPGNVQVKKLYLKVKN